MNRNLNVGFSGGEKKRNEIFQMAMLEPKLGILDETDSGLDIDALRIVAGGVNKLRSKDNAFIVVTHYQRLLDYIVPDVVHVMADGRIIKSGPKELALELEGKGYDWVKGIIRRSDECRCRDVAHGNSRSHLERRPTTIDSMSTATISTPRPTCFRCSKASTWPGAAEALAQA
jgi:ABC-type multidrug transport system ATPase subunit